MTTNTNINELQSRINRLKSDIARYDSERTRLTAKRDSEMERLTKDFGCRSIIEAADLITKLQEEKSGLEMQIDSILTSIEEVINGHSD